MENQISTFEIMRKFHFEKLGDIFITRFINDLGMNKAKEIFEKVNSSKKVHLYLMAVGNNSYRPTRVGIISTLNNVPYFIVCKGETLCAGALCVLLNWNNSFNEGERVINEGEVTSVAVDIINYCYKIKMNKKDSLFNRFFNDIRLIDKQEKDSTPLSDFWDNDGFDYGDRWE